MMGGYSMLKCRLTVKSIIKKFLALIMILLIILNAPIPVYADSSSLQNSNVTENVKDIYKPQSYMYVNGTLLNKDDGTAFTARGTVYVPLKAIVEGMGDKYNDDVITRQDGTQIVIYIGRSYVLVNENSCPIAGDEEPFSLDEVTYVPVSVITDYLKYPVSIKQANDKTYTFIGKVPDNFKIDTSEKNPFVLPNNANTATEAGTECGSTNSDVINRNMILQKGDWIYYIDNNNQLIRMKPDGGSKIRLARAVWPGFCVLGSYAYYTASLNSKYNALLYRVKIDGTHTQKFGNFNVGSFNVVGSWIYYQNGDNGKLYKTSIDGKKTIKLSNDEVNYINVESSYIYYANLSDKGRIYKIKTDGTNRIKLTDDVVYSNAHLVDNGYIYYTCGDNFIKMTVDGKNKTILAAGYPFAPYIVGDYIYLSCYSEHARKEMTDYINGNGQCPDLTENDYLFMRMKKDGTDKQYLSDVSGNIEGATKDSIYAFFNFNYFGDWGNVRDYYTPILKMNKNDLSSIQFFGSINSRLYGMNTDDIVDLPDKLYRLVNNTESKTPDLLYNQDAYNKHIPMYYMECNGTTYYMEACPELYLLELNGTSLNEIKAAMSDSLYKYYININSLLGKKSRIYAYTVDRDTDEVERVVLQGTLKVKLYDGSVPPKKIVKLSYCSGVQVLK